jgi:hypothetical protein
VEDEFFDREHFASRADFYAKATTYWRYFNIARLNRGKGWKSPLTILREREPQLHPAIASWQVLDLNTTLSHYFPRYLPQRGHDLPVHPFFRDKPGWRGRKPKWTAFSLASRRSGASDSSATVMLAMSEQG